jgi:hypothetical protein
MKQDRFNVRRALSSMLPLVMMAMSGLILSPRTAWTQELVVKSVAEMKVKQLPTGPLFWRVENFPTLAQAQAAAGPTSLAAVRQGLVVHARS